MKAQDKNTSKQLIHLRLPVVQSLKLIVRRVDTSDRTKGAPYDVRVMTKVLIVVN